MASNIFLIADIGGTNTRLALSKNGTVQHSTIEKLQNAEFASFDDVLKTYRERHPTQSLTATCVAIAGPVDETSGTLTNLNWTLQTDNLAEVTQAPSFIINDLQAQGYALDELQPANIRHIFGPSPTASTQTKLVCGIGTGYNIAQVHYIGTQLYVPPAEAGHASLPFTFGTSLDLMETLAAERGFLSVEDILSGSGLARLGNALRQTSGLTSQDIIAEASRPDGAQDIVSCFAQVAGSVIGDSALALVPKGGIYLTGGMARAVTPFLSAESFGRAFCDKGRFSDFMKVFSIALVEDDFAALKGCVRFLNQSVVR
ncbi:MAG: ROK family protein [Paracoccaceae bacterium]